MRQNVGHLDAYLRLVTGFLLLGWGLRTPHPSRAVWLMLLGAGRIAEGLTRWCPLMAALGIDSLSSEERFLGLAHTGPRYGRIVRNPYRMYPEDEMSDFRPRDGQANGMTTHRSKPATSQGS